MNISLLSSKYGVRRLNEQDVEIIYELYRGNPLFFHFCPPQVTREGIRQDMKALPPRVMPENKHYVGFYDGERLLAIMDLVLGYPCGNTAWIGLFMVEAREQGRGIGSGIIEECVRFLNNQGYPKIRLAYAKGNPQSERFWVKNGFRRVGNEIERDGYTAVPMEYTFQAGREDRYPHGRRLWRADR